MLRWRAGCAFGQPSICRQGDAGWDLAGGSHVLGLGQGAGVQALRVRGGEGSLKHRVQPPRSHSHTVNVAFSVDELLLHVDI